MTPHIQHTLEPERTEVSEPSGPLRADITPNNALLAGCKELLDAWDKFVRKEISQEEYCAVCKRVGALERALEAHYKARDKA